MQRFWVVPATSLCFLTAMAGCGGERSPDHAPKTPAGVLESLSKDGWVLYDTVLQFTPDSLYEQINGRAELYLSYDVVGLSYASFDNTTDPGLSISLSVYDMGSPLMAFGIYSVERSAGEEKVELGREAYRSNADLYVWHGRYYIRAISTDTGDESRQTNLGWVRRIVESLPDTGEAVKGLDLLPTEGLVEDSVRYFKIDAMGLDFMGNTFTAQYTRNSGPIDAFVSRGDSPGAAQTVMDLYREYADRYGKGTEIVPIDGTDFLVADMGGAYDAMAVKGSVICGVTAAEDRERALEGAAELCSR